MSEEPFYVVRDVSGAIYGPANVGTLRIWIGEGRITREMQIARQGTRDFVQAGQMRELAGAFPDEPAAFTQQPTPTDSPATSPTVVQQPATPVAAALTQAAAEAQASTHSHQDPPTYAARANPVGSIPTEAQPLPPDPAPAYPQTQPQGYSQNYPQGYQQGYPVSTKSSGMATASLIFGIVGFLVCGASLVAIITGHLARGQIRREPDKYEGSGMATAGLVLGYLGLLLEILVGLVFLLIFVASMA